MVKIRQGKRFSEAEIRALRAELAALPRGSVTRKVIKGVARFYLQWAEKGGASRLSDAAFQLSTVTSWRGGHERPPLGSGVISFRGS